jgi:ABC-type nickel/cobalt efflux system permease component RcnA
MFGASMLWLWILWAAVTLCFGIVMIWRSLVGLKEEDVVILDPAEDKQADEQRETIRKVMSLTRWAKAFGYSSLALLLVTGSLWLYRGMNALRTGGNP